MCRKVLFYSGQSGTFENSEKLSHFDEHATSLHCAGDFWSQHVAFLPFLPSEPACFQSFSLSGKNKNGHVNKISLFLRFCAPGCLRTSIRSWLTKVTSSTKNHVLCIALPNHSAQYGDIKRDITVRQPHIPWSVQVHVRSSFERNLTFALTTQTWRILHVTPRGNEGPFSGHQKVKSSYSQATADKLDIQLRQWPDYARFCAVSSDFVFGSQSGDISVHAPDRSFATHSSVTQTYQEIILRYCLPLPYRKRDAGGFENVVNEEESADQIVLKRLWTKKTWEHRKQTMRGTKNMAIGTSINIFRPTWGHL